MKIKTALKQSKAAVKVFAVPVVLFAALAAYWPSWPTFALLGFSVFLWVMEAINIVHIRRKAAKDPAFLEQKIR